MMFDIPSILTSDELIDKAFKRASKVSIIEVNRIARIRKNAIAKITTVANTIDSTLASYIKKFPSFDKLSPFYRELIDVVAGVDKLKKSLGAIDWCRKSVLKIANETNRRIQKLRKIDEIAKEQTSVYGRTASITEQVSKELEFLSKVRVVLKKMPAIDPQLPTIVVAGYPNVGKSLLVAKISSAKPKIAEYPFTTKGIGIGHFERKYQTYQVVDTPGLLDREFSKRNPIEKQAILALKHLADVIVFLLDPTETCGYHLNVQLNLLSTIKEIFADIPIIEVENKFDMLKTASERLKISALIGEGIEELIAIILSYIERNEGDKYGQIG